ncbi:hypothetical protein YP76_05990 [Sphingobium chungbukense]|uniref:Uncharacterized protein n=1 Tax=Sphingobium chungbukense TaxID=56193 RepID=A0A0M3ARN1_9SPHN|nr:hypothetical protein YP76_05990 [Sphingobium chungbukense]
MSDDAIIAASWPLMIDLIEGDAGKIGFTVAGLGTTALHVSVTKLRSGRSQNALRIEDEHDQHRCVGFVTKTALTRLSNAFNVELRWRSGTKIKPHPIMRVVARCIDVSGGNIARPRVGSIISRTKHPG